MSQITQFITPAAVNLTLTGNAGGAVGPTANNINILGAGGVTVTGNPGTSTLTITVGGAFAWQDQAVDAVMVPNNGYIANNGAGLTMTLPAVAAIGDIVAIVGKNAAGWTIAQNGGQTIHFGNMNTTTGVGGSLASLLQYDCVELICIIANTDFVVRTSVGNLVVT